MPGLASACVLLLYLVLTRLPASGLAPGRNAACALAALTGIVLALRLGMHARERQWSTQAWANGPHSRFARGAFCLILVCLLSAWGLHRADALLGTGESGPVKWDAIAVGTICEFPKRQPGAARFLFQVHETGAHAALPARILVTWYDATTPPAMGEVWRFKLRMRRAHASINPGAFDFERWLFSQRIGATAWVVEDSHNEPLATLAPACPGARARRTLADRIAGTIGDRPAAAYVLGLSVGAYQALPDAEWERLRRTGTVHLISISGFHIALVAGPFAALGVLIGRMLLRAGASVRPRLIGAWIAVAAAAFYGILAGFSVPTARSVAVLAVMAIVLCSRRQIAWGSAFAVVVLAVLCMEPFAVLIPGFWLSFAGVGLLTLVAARARRQSPGAGAPWARAGRALVSSAGLLGVTQIAMTVGLAPLLAVFFGQLPLAGAVANFVAVPAFSFILLPLTLLGAALAFPLPAAGDWLLLRAADGFDLWRAFVAMCSDLPFALWHLPEPHPVAIALATLGVLWMLAPVPWPRRLVAPLLMAGLLGSRHAGVTSGGLRVLVLDVGQGLAVLVQTTSHALVYDAGPRFRNGDAGDRVVVPVLQALGIRALDVLVISHPDSDHRGGAASVLARHPAALLRGTGITGRPGLPCLAGERWNWDGVHFEFLHPGPSFAASGDNDASCVLRITARHGSVLLTGDIETAGEEAVLSDGTPSADLVVVPHHGSRSSSSLEFVAATNARHAVFSTGFDNRWKFPAAEVVARWTASGACTADTADSGALWFEATPDEGMRLVRRQRAVAPGVWITRPPASPCVPVSVRGGRPDV